MENPNFHYYTDKAQSGMWFLSVFDRVNGCEVFYKEYPTEAAANRAWARWDRKLTKALSEGKGI